MFCVMQADEDAGKAGKAGGKRFEIKKWNAVAMWSWAICTDTCAICRNNLYEPSIEYQANPNGELLRENVTAMRTHAACECKRFGSHNIAKVTAFTMRSQIYNSALACNLMPDNCCRRS